jgi:hypothetical protein
MAGIETRLKIYTEKYLNVYDLLICFHGSQSRKIGSSGRRKDFG